MFNKDLLIATIFALGIHILFFFINPSGPTTLPLLIGEKRVIEVSLVRSAKPKSPVPKLIKKPQKVPLSPKPIVKKKVEESSKEDEVEKEPDFIPAKVKTEEVGEVIETEPKSEKGGDTYNIKAMVTTAIPDYRENPKPYYPIMARKRGHQGTLVLQVEVLSDGTVGRIKLKKSSGYLSLDNSTIEAVKKWKFIPGRRGNIPITMWVNVPVRFELKNRK